MRNNKIIMLISGSGGVGKNTLINGLLSDGKAKFISSYTTRQRRESDGLHQYNFISKQEFETKIKDGEIFEYDVVNNEYYGTSRALFENGFKENDVVLKDITILGYENCKELMGKDYNIVSVFLTEKKSVLKQRLIDRGDSKEKIKARMCLYKKEQPQMIKYKYIIRNNNYNNSIDKLNAIIDVEQGKDMVYPYKDYTNINAEKIDKIANKLDSNKKISPIKFALIDKKIYIVNGVHKYLASLKTGKIVPGVFIDAKNKDFKFNKEEWQKIVDSYDIKK